jgi:hypothetical protein
MRMGVCYLSPMSKLLRVWVLTAVAFGAGWMASRLAAPADVRADANRVFELRVYHANPGKLAGLQKLFHDATLPMFKKHGMTSIGYWVPQDAPQSQNTWIYIIAHPSREAAKANWAAFQADPEWKAKFTAAQAEGPLVDHIDSTFMDPATISPIK